MARLFERYKTESISKLRKEFGYKSPSEVPAVRNITINIGVGEAIHNIKVLDQAINDLKVITGQMPVVTKAKKAIAGFKLRQGMPIGCMVTLRKVRMYEFMDRLFNVAIPRIKDFKGVNPKAFDGRGNYSLGLKEHTIFPEVDYDSVEKMLGMSVTFVTTAKTDNEGKALLASLGMPFRT